MEDLVCTSNWDGSIYRNTLFLFLIISNTLLFWLPLPSPENLKFIQFFFFFHTHIDCNPHLLFFNLSSPLSLSLSLSLSPFGNKVWELYFYKKKCCTFSFIMIYDTLARLKNGIFKICVYKSYIYIYTHKRFMVLPRSIGELMKVQIWQYC